MGRVMVRQRPEPLECRAKEEEKKVYLYIRGTYAGGIEKEEFNRLYETVGENRADMRRVVRAKSEQHYYAEQANGVVKVYRGITGRNFLEVPLGIFQELFEPVRNRFDVITESEIVFDIGEDVFGELKVFQHRTDRVIKPLTPREAVRVFHAEARGSKERRVFLDMLIRQGEVEFSILSEPKGETFRIRVNRGEGFIGYQVLGSPEHSTRTVENQCRNVEEVLQLLEKPLRREGQKLDLESIRF